MLLLTSLLLALTPPEVDAARAVMVRTIGSRARSIDLKWVPAAKESYSIRAVDGKLRIEGSTPIALCRGFYDYLKQYCHSSVSWEGAHIQLPPSWPTATMQSTALAPLRHYYNICTFGYTTAFWDWKRWRREIDWMALHGINMPLAMTGQDKVWQTVFRSYGVPQSSLDAFFSGPGFQPWHWMGNLNGHGGPTPQSWIDGQAALQKQILKEERALGMKPVVPGFSGFVPVDFNKYVKTKLDSPTAWAGFQPTKFVDVRDPKFIEIGRKFVEAYRQEFGSDHYYLCDTFNEQNPQFPAESKLQDLKSAGAAVYEGLRQADPVAKWVMQGWLFYNERDYWGAPEVEALLSGVPDDRMIILDLAAEQYPVYKALPSVARKGFIYCTLHNFGQNTSLGGDVESYLQSQNAAALSGTNIQGLGLTPEGIDQNPFVYELLLDGMWSDGGQVPFQDRVSQYVTARYGYPESTKLSAAWNVIVKALYSKSSPWYKDGWRSRPGRVRRGRPLSQMQQLETALTSLTEEGRRLPKLGKNPLFQRDLVDLVKTWLGGIADRESAIALTHPGKYNEDRFFATLDDIDRIMACRPEHRVSTWIRQARSWGKTAAEKDLLERNARLQITAWDYNGVLNDYANKEWAGLTNGFLAQRWRLYFLPYDLVSESRAAQKIVRPSAKEFQNFEVSWAKSTAPIQESRPSDPVALAEALLLKYKGAAASLDSQMGLLEPPGNIARNGHAFDDGGTEGAGTADKAIDGDLDTYWAASPAPRTWTLDLGSVQLVKRIVLFPYSGDGRYYQYKISGSSDGNSWREVADASSNTTESSDLGYTHELNSPVSMRYIRVEVLKNSANIGVHLCEVRVYSK